MNHNFGPRVSNYSAVFGRLSSCLILALDFQDISRVPSLNCEKIFTFRFQVALSLLQDSNQHMLGPLVITI